MPYPLSSVSYTTLACVRLTWLKKWETPSGAGRLGTRLRSGFVRPDEPYPSFYYRYSHDIAHVFGLRIFGIYAHAGVVKIRWWLLFLNLVVIVAPIGAGFIEYRISNASSSEALISIGWIVYFSFLAIVVQACSYAGVKVFHGMTPSVEQCLTRKGMARYERWASVSTALFPQLGWAVLWSALGCLALYLLTLEPVIAEAIHVTWASYLSVGVSVFYLAGGIWWIFAGSLLSIFIAGDGCMRLLPYAPAMTPGLELLVRCYRLAFTGACVGVVLCLTPILTWTSVLPTSGVAVLTTLALVALSFLALIVVAILPDWMLSKAILRHRHRLLTSINDRLPQRPSTAGRVETEEEYLLVWMQTLASTPRGTMSESVVVTIIAALLSSTLPLIITQFISR